MSFLTDFLLALGLSMDAFAVSMYSNPKMPFLRVDYSFKRAFFRRLSGSHACTGLDWRKHSQRLCCGLCSLDCLWTSCFYRDQNDLRSSLRKLGRKGRYP